MNIFTSLLRRNFLLEINKSILNKGKKFDQNICNFSRISCLLQKRKNNGIDDQDQKSSKQKEQKQKEKFGKSLVNITLLTNNQTSVCTLEEAQKLSKRRDMKLLKINDLDLKTQRAVYKLVSSSELLKEEIDGNQPNDKSSKKNEKLLTIGSKISDNDLSSKINHLGKWLGKSFEVRLLIQCSSADDIEVGEKIYKKIETFVQENNGKIAQKRVKGSSIKFNILPVPAVKKDQNI